MCSYLFRIFSATLSHCTLNIIFSKEMNPINKKLSDINGLSIPDPKEKSNFLSNILEDNKPEY